MIVASAFDSEAEVERKYPDSAVHTASVLDLGGKILFGVDATKLETCPDLKGSRSRFSKIVFNFPHAGESGNFILIITLICLEMKTTVLSGMINLLPVIGLIRRWNQGSGT